MASDPDTGSAQYAEFVKALVDSEDSRRAALESRGSGVITSSGALVTLLLAIAALVRKQEGFALSSSTVTFLIISTIAFVCAALLAMTTYAPRVAKIVDAAKLKNELRMTWNEGADYAKIIITATWLDQLGALQRSNDVKAWLLMAAVLTEVVAVVVLGIAVVSLL